MIPNILTIPGTASDRRRWIALVVVCFGQLMIVLDSTIVNVALTAIQRDLHFSQASLTWVINAYLITYGSFVLLAGRAGDLIGRKRVFLSGVFLFTAASVLCGFAQDPALLIAGRFLQGAGGALSAGVIIAIIVTGFTRPDERAQAMGVFTFTIAGGGSLGLLAGGLLTQWISWHWIFFINLPIGVATLLLGRALIEENEGIGLSHGVDVLGSLLVSSALALGVYGIVTSAEYGWGSAHTLTVGGGAVALLAAFVWLEARLENPILPLRILRIRSLTGASAARSLLAAGLFTTFFIGALYLQHVRGYSAFGTGLAFLPFTLALAALSLGITARLMRRFGPNRILAGGLFLVIAALALLAGAGENAGYFPRLFVAYVLFGVGAGASFMPLTIIAMAEVPAVDAGLAAGISNVTMQISAAIGLAAMGTISADHSRLLVAQGYPFTDALAGGYQLAFTIAAGCVALGLLVVLVVLRSPRRAALTEARAEDSDETDPVAEAA
jgi:EmrB/QacA subfamily drug resistance transporter